MIFTVKVNHRSFLDDKDSGKLNSFGIKTVLNNHVYREYSCHFLSTVELSDEQVNELCKVFKCSIDNDKIIIDMEK